MVVESQLDEQGVRGTAKSARAVRPAHRAADRSAVLRQAARRGVARSPEEDLRARSGGSGDTPVGSIQRLAGARLGRSEASAMAPAARKLPAANKWAERRRHLAAIAPAGLEGEKLVRLRSQVRHGIERQ